MDNSKNSLVSQYEIQAARVSELETQLAEAQASARATLEALMNAHGAGPFHVNGKDIVVLRRRGCMQTMPAVRTRKPKASVQAEAAAAE